MIEGQLKENNVVLDETEFYDRSWYGELKNRKNILSSIEAFHLAKEKKIDIYKGSKKLSLKNFLDTVKDPEFMIKYYVYADLRERGLIVKVEKDSFIVYERGSKKKKGNIAWIVFVSSEDSAAEIAKFEKITKTKDQSIWAVVDNDSDITYYMVSEEDP
jgi:tRNA-intron endonuclease